MEHFINHFVAMRLEKYIIAKFWRSLTINPTKNWIQFTWQWVRINLLKLLNAFITSNMLQISHFKVPIVCVFSVIFELSLPCCYF